MTNFACPYRKRDPTTYGLAATHRRACSAKGWATLHGVRQVSPLHLCANQLISDGSSCHLAKRHDDHLCGRCLDRFPSTEELEAHSSGCKARVTDSKDERWQTIWSQLFPDDGSHPSPCKSCSSVLPAMPLEYP